MDQNHEYVSIEFKFNIIHQEHNMLDGKFILFVYLTLIC